MRLCSRPTCAEPAGSTLGYDYARRRAWLEPLTPQADPSGHDLCDHHADLLAVPLGWSLEDLREPLDLRAGAEGPDGEADGPDHDADADAEAAVA